MCFADFVTFHFILTWTADFLQRFVTFYYLLTYTLSLETDQAFLVITITAHHLLVWPVLRDVGVVAAGYVLLHTL